MDISNNNNNYSLLEGFKRAWTIDYRTLALFRVLIAGIVLTDLFFRSQYFVAFFTDQGILPRSVVINWFGNASYSLYFINGSVFFSSILFAMAVIAAWCLLLGYKTRIATVVSWVLLVSLQHRTSILSSGADDLMRMLLFWGMFLPIGAKYSIDAAMEKNVLYTKPGHFSIATVAMLMQVLYVYWVGALLKTHANWHVDYTAIHFALNAEDYSTSLGMWVLNTFGVLLPFLTRFVLYIEQFGPLFLVSPILLLWFRLPVLFLLIAMHIGFVLLLNVGHFPYVSICSLLLFLPKEFWGRVSQFKWSRREQGVTVFYDESCDFCLKTVMLIKHVCVLPSIKILPAQSDKLAGPILKKHDSWVIQKANGETLIEWSALAYLVGLSPVFFWMTWPLKLMIKLNIGNKFYHFIGDRRVLLGRFTAKTIPWTHASEKASYWNHVLVTFFMIFCFYVNMQPIFPKVLPKESGVVLDGKRMLGLWQKWDMFAPKPVQQTRWPIFEGITNDGHRVDIFRQEKGSAPTAKPKHILSDYEYYRWRKYFSRLYLKKYSYLRRHFVQYECRRWNKGKPYRERVKEITLKMGTEVTRLNAQAETSKIESMGKYKCK